MSSSRYEEGVISSRKPGGNAAVPRCHLRGTKKVSSHRGSPKETLQFRDVTFEVRRRCHLIAEARRKRCRSEMSSSRYEEGVISSRKPGGNAAVRRCHLRGTVSSHRGSPEETLPFRDVTFKVRRRCHLIAEAGRKRCRSEMSPARTSQMTPLHFP